jgi:hypothetical protein
MSVLEHRHQRLSSGSYELLASRCNAFAVHSTTSRGSGLMEPPPSPFPAIKCLQIPERDTIIRRATMLLLLKQDLIRLTCA